MSVRIRGFDDGDAGFIQGLVAREGWNAGRHDVETFTAADRGAWSIAEVDGTPVGITLATRWNDTFGWIGLYLVEPVFRGRGIGLTLFRAALERLRPRAVGLDGDPRQQENYRRSGFADVHGNTRWHGPAGAWRDVVTPSRLRLVAAADVPAADLVSFDARAVGGERPALLRAWVDQPDATSVVALRGADVAGFATARPARLGWKVAPVYAVDVATASAVIGAVTAHLPDEMTCWLDVPDPNRAAAALVATRGYGAAPTSGRMVCGQAPPADPTIAFALLAHEVG